MGAPESNAGDDFHFWWAATRALELIESGADLRLLTLEGLASVDDADDAYETVDVGEYFGGNDAATAYALVLSQLKYSSRHSGLAWTAARLCETRSRCRADGSSGPPRSVIADLAGAYRRLLDDNGLAIAAKAKIALVSNQPGDRLLLQSVAAAAAWVGEQAGPAQRADMLAALPDEFAGVIRVLSGAIGARLKSTEFCSFLAALDFSQTGALDRAALARAVRAGAHQLTPGRGPDSALRLFHLVRERAMPGTRRDITAHDVLAELGAPGLIDLYPAPPRLADIPDLLPAPGARDIAEAAISHLGQVIVAHGGAGAGKTTALRQVADHLPAGSAVVLFDCYGGGDYLSSGEERHTPQRFAAQVINELAQRCGTPLIVQPPQLEADLWRRFSRTLERAASTLDPGAVLVVAVDAADNAVIAATERGDHSFLPSLAGLRLPDRVALILTARSHRVPSLGADPAAIVELAPFDATTSAAHLRRRCPDALDEEATAFHDRTGGTVHYHAAAGLQERTTSGGVVVGDIPQKPPGFQLRPGLLAALDVAGPGGSVVRAVTGMRGVGKTQLAAAYARAKLAEGWRLVAWVNAEDAASLAGGLAAVAEDAGLAAQGGDPGRAVRHWLEAGGDRCLLVFDDAADPDMLQPYLPVAGAGRVLVTSNRQSVADLGESVGVGAFTPMESAAFLAGRARPGDPAGAHLVAEELGFLPLALAQAAAVIRGQHLTYGTYLERLRALPVAQYLTRRPGQPYPHGVAEAVLLSLRTVQDGDGAGECAAVIEVLSVLSAAGVRRDLLHAAGQAGASETRLDAAAVDEALGRLAESSLLTFSLDDRVIAHRLVLRVVRDTLVQQGRLAAVCRAAASVLDARARALAGSLDRAAVRDVPEQVTALWDATVVLAGTSGDLEAALVRLRLWALHHLNELGDSMLQAIAVGEPLRDDAERVLGSDDPSTLAARSCLANAYQDAGRVTEAIDLHEQTLVAQERVLGPDHPSTLTSRSNLATGYRDAGRVAEAIPLHEQALAARERVLGPAHPDTLASRNNLANAYQAAGRVAEAVGLHEQTLVARERVLGLDHPGTLASRGNLAAAYQAAGRAAKAIPLYEQVLAAREQALGPDHPDTLNLRSNLAAAYQAAGRVAEAVGLCEQTVVARERVLGLDHPGTLASRGNLAAAYQAAGRIAEAIPLYEQVLAVQERVLDPDHPSILASRSNLAAAYRDAGRIAKAIGLHEQALADRERVLGPDHPDTLGSRNNLAAAYRAAGRTAEAISLYEHALAARERVLGPDNPDILASRNNLANAYQDVGRAAEAIPMHEQTLADRERVLGPDHPDTLGSRNNLAAAYVVAGRPSEAISLNEETLTACKRVLGLYHPLTLMSQDNLGEAYQGAGRYADAIPLHEQTLAALERVLGLDHPYTLTSRNNLAAAKRGETG